MADVVSFGREVVQARLLAQLFRQGLGQKLVLKGGMAMRAAYGSVRYTKDIDLAADPSLSLPVLERAVKSAINNAASLGLMTDLKVTMPKRSETTLRWKLAGMIGASTINLTVEISRRQNLSHQNLQKVVYSPSSEYGIQPITIDVFDHHLMCASKVDCLCNPNREESRDIHDLGILIELAVTPPPDLVARIGRERLKTGLTSLWSKIEKLDWTTMSQALGPYIPQETMDQLTPEIWDDIRMQVGYKVETWIKDALKWIEESEGKHENSSLTREEEESIELRIA